MGNEWEATKLQSIEAVNINTDSVFILPKHEEIKASRGFFSEREENTLAGALIGSVRDIVSEPQSRSEKVERASSNDFLGNVVADVLVMVPRFKAVKAGMARSALLVNPHDGLMQNPLNLGSNFIEGAALNKVSRSMLPDSKLSSLTSRYLGSGLKAEVATHLSAGFGFGAVKSGFDSRTWLDQDGNFSAVSGLESMAKTGTGAALINLPAGMVGLRSANLAGKAVRSDLIGTRAGSLLIGTTSGYTSGAVVGGIEAIKHGKNFYETLEGMNQAGLVGAGTGFAFMGAMPVDRTNFSPRSFAKSGRETLIDLTAEANLAARAESMEAQLAAAGSKSGNRFRPIEQLELPASGAKLTIEAMEAALPARRRNIPLSKLEYHQRDNIRLEDLSRRLVPPTSRKEPFVYLPEKAVRAKYTSFEDFSSNLRQREVDVRVYKVKGDNTEILVPEPHARKLDQIRVLRWKAKEVSALDKLPEYERKQIFSDFSREANGNPQGLDGLRKNVLLKHMSESEAEHSLSVWKARESLSTNRDNSYALPEDILAVIEELPNPSLIKTVVVHDGANPNDVWTSQTYEPGFISAATASPDGVITFYQPKIDFLPSGSRGVNIDGNLSRANLRSYANHEWSHLAHFGDDLNFGLYKLAEIVDLDVDAVHTAPTLKESKLPQEVRDLSLTDKYFSRTYARRNLKESWAVSQGEEFMSVELADFMILSERAPLRTTVVARNVNDNLTSGASRSVFGDALSGRVDHTKTAVVPEAWKVLEARVASGSNVEKLAAAELLGHLGNRDRHVDALISLADDPASKTVRDTVESLTEGLIKRDGSPKGRTELTLADTAFDAARRLSSDRFHGEPDVSFLVNQVKNGKGQARELAQERLMAMQGGDDLLRFANLKGDELNMTQLLELLPGMRNKAGQNLVFDEILALGKKGEFGSEFTTSVLVRTINTVPGVRAKALAELGNRIARDPSMATREIESYISNLSVNRDAGVAERAEKILVSMRHGKDVARVTELLETQKPEARLQGLKLASGVKDRSLIDPLLRVVQGGSLEEANLAAQALKQYEGQIVKFQMNLLKSEGVSFDAQRMRLVRG